VKREKRREKSCGRAANAARFFILPMFGKMRPNLPNIGKSVGRARDVFCHEMSGSPRLLDEGRSRISSLDQRTLGKERAEAKADAECQPLAKSIGICQTLANQLQCRA
jgi:hypothetical protein